MPDNTNPKTFECPTGFIIAADEEGNYLPFLIKTRTQDLEYGNMELTDEFLKILIDMGCTEIERYYPSPTYHFNLKDWECELINGKHLIANIELRVDDIDEVFTLRDKIDAIYYEDNILRFERRFYDSMVEFPFELAREGFTINTTMNAFSSELKSSILSVDTSSDNGDNISQITLSIVVNAVPEDNSDAVVEYHEPSNGLRVYSRYLEFYNDGIVINDDMDVGLVFSEFDDGNRTEDGDGIYLPEDDSEIILNYDGENDAVQVMDDSVFIDEDGIVLEDDIMDSDLSKQYDESIYLALNEHSTVAKQFSVFIRIEGDIANLKIFEDGTVKDVITLE